MAILVTRLTHGAIIRCKSDSYRRYISSFLNGLKESSLDYDSRTGRYKQVELGSRGTYCIAEDREGYWRYGILDSDYDEFMAYLRRMNILADEIKVTDIRDQAVGLPSKFKMNEKWKPRDEHQQEAVDFVLKPGHIRVLHADTGFGKTFCGYYSASLIGTRTGFIMAPGHIDGWLEKLFVYSDIPKDRVLLLKGKESILAAIDMAKAGTFHYDVIFISSDTLQSFITTYESAENQDTDVTPWELFQLMGIGYIIRDESHESIFQVIKQTIYCNVNKVTYLSATLVNDTDLRKKLYPKVFPLKDRWESPVNKHIHTIPLYYRTRLSKPIKCRGAKGYSHTKYEKDIMRRKRLYNSYNELIWYVTKKGYYEIKQPDGKFWIYCSLKEYCKQLAAFLQEKMPDLKVGYFLGGMPKELLNEYDVSIGTSQAMGTGKDVQSLEALLQTVAIGSEGLSRQICGRLRPYEDANGVKHPDIHPRYYYLVNADERKHIEYDRMRRNYMSKRSWKISIGKLNYILTDR